MCYVAFVHLFAHNHNLMLIPFTHLQLIYVFFRHYCRAGSTEQTSKSISWITVSCNLIIEFFLIFLVAYLYMNVRKWIKFDASRHIVPVKITCQISSCLLSHFTTYFWFFFKKEQKHPILLSNMQLVSSNWNKVRGILGYSITN